MVTDAINVNGIGTPEVKLGIFKLVDGSTIIANHWVFSAEYPDEDEIPYDVFKLERPRQILMIQQGNKRFPALSPIAGFEEYMDLYPHGVVGINHEHVPEYLEKMYLKSTTKIEIANSLPDLKH